MKRFRIANMALATLIYGVFTSVSASAQQTVSADSGFNLTVQVTDVQHQEGKLLVAVFNQPAGFPKEIDKAIASIKILPSQGQTTFAGLPAGPYAVVVLHDRNNSGKMDKNFMGMPTEPVGLSNYQSIGLTNMPDFRKAAFQLNQSGLLKVKLIEM